MLFCESTDTLNVILHPGAGVGDSIFSVFNYSLTGGSAGTPTGAIALHRLFQE